MFLDLTKAFDTVDHGILLSKLSAVGLSGNSLNWFQSYITKRSQRTCCESELSSKLPITHGVPQESILGPLLFVIYINDLPSVLQSSSASLYADDTVIYCYGSSSRELSEKLNIRTSLEYPLPPDMGTTENCVPGWVGIKRGSRMTEWRNGTERRNGMGIKRGTERRNGMGIKRGMGIKLTTI